MTMEIHCWHMQIMKTRGEKTNYSYTLSTHEKHLAISVGNVMKTLKKKGLNAILVDMEWHCDKIYYVLILKSMVHKAI